MIRKCENWFILLKEKILVHPFLAPKKPENNGKRKKTTEQQQKTLQNTEKHNKNLKISKNSEKPKKQNL